MGRAIWDPITIGRIACLILVNLMTAGSLCAQESVLAQEPIISPLELVVWSKQKREVISNRVKVSQAEAAAFWQVYEYFDNSRRILCNERISLLTMIMQQDSAEEGFNKAIHDRLQVNEVDFEKMYRDYYKQFRRIISARRATYLIVMEKYFQDVLNNRLDSAAQGTPELESLSTRR